MPLSSFCSWQTTDEKNINIHINTILLSRESIEYSIIIDIYRQPIHRYYAVTIVGYVPGPIRIRDQQGTTDTRNFRHQRQANRNTFQPLRAGYEHTAIFIDIHILSEGVTQRLVFSRQMDVRPQPVQIFPLKRHLQPPRLRAMQESKGQDDETRETHHHVSRKELFASRGRGIWTNVSRSRLEVYYAQKYSWQWHY